MKAKEGIYLGYYYKSGLCWEMSYEQYQALIKRLEALQREE